MAKKFISWIFNKIIIDKTYTEREIKEHEVYWCSFGENIGFEQNGKGEDFRRPVLIFKKFNNNLFWGVPMSTKIKDNRYYVKVLLKNIEQAAIISQLRVLDSKRLDDKISYISELDFWKIKLKIIDILFYKM
jgi:mRNA-degrading endonuclease toxin of MazEF toxin-antitoxin module